ncbi:hypothetical protein EYC80_003513 [Monilinia laxa]|uniref:Uncharacterized protein n=1 Tax=Monilinia laxa TaxID=61186 RepID=A0A5N6KDV6_MONLA|nr:hypothetical protein EYC80_003513 [Monilinia laxa]
MIECLSRKIRFKALVARKIHGMEKKPAQLELVTLEKIHIIFTFIIILSPKVSSETPVLLPSTIHILQLKLIFQIVSLP